MEKIYIKPETHVHTLRTDSIMIQISVGEGGNHIAETKAAHKFINDDEEESVADYSDDVSRSPFDL